jgi:hypothetical protein
MSGPDDLFNFEPNFAEINIEPLEHIRGDAGTFFHQTEEDMLSPDVFMVEALSLLIGQLHDFASTVGESLVHSISPRLSRDSVLLSSRCFVFQIPFWLGGRRCFDGQ